MPTERYFFYGTLADRATLERVIGRPVPDTAVQAASVKGYRRVAIRGQPYPSLRRDLQGEAEGVVVSGIGPTEAARLGRYEGPLYRIVRLAAVDARGGRAWAKAFVARPGVPLTDIDWRPEAPGPEREHEEPRPPGAGFFGSGNR